MRVKLNIGAQVMGPVSTKNTKQQKYGWAAEMEKSLPFYQVTFCYSFIYIMLIPTIPDLDWSLNALGTE